MAQQQSVPMPWTQANATTLATAIMAGVHTVDYGEYRVIYRSTTEMQGLLDRMVRYLNAQGDGQPLPNTRGSVFISR